MIETIHIVPLSRSDPDVISSAFNAIGWNRSASQYHRYLQEQDRGVRVVLVAWADSFVGYVTLLWTSDYGPMKRDGVPEIQDLNVLSRYRRMGIGSKLLNEVELIASTRGTEVGIAVGLHPGYNAAQRLYVKRGYVPDGCGVTYRNEFIREGAVICADDDLLLHLRKRLSVSTETR
jgi:GNAT superfamily N-acetyltransferase